MHESKLDSGQVVLGLAVSEDLLTVCCLVVPPVLSPLVLAPLGLSLLVLSLLSALWLGRPGPLLEDPGRVLVRSRPASERPCCHQSRLQPKSWKS